MIFFSLIDFFKAIARIERLWSFATDPGSNAYVIGDSNPRVMHLGDVMVMFPIVFLVCSSYLFSFVSFVNLLLCV